MNPRRELNRAAATTCIILLLASVLFAAGCTNLPGTSPGLTQAPVKDGKLAAYFFDVGQGDAELILFGNTTILIDAGETEMGERVIADLEKLGVTRIDLLVLTHPHSDHIGGILAVLDTFPVGTVLDAGVPSTSTIYEKLLLKIEKKKIPYQVAEQGQTIDLDPLLRILVLSPPHERLNDDPNQNSVVLRVSYGTVNILYTGDLGGETEAALAKSGYPLDAQILKLGHHGSSSSTSAAFLSRVSPEVAIISLASDNPYGHPHDATLQRLSGAGVTVYRTDRDGTILVRSNGISYSVSTENSGTDIWSTPAAATTVATSIPTTATTTPAALQAISLNASAIVPSIPANVTIPSTLPAIQLGNASSVFISATQFNSPGDDRENLNGEWVRITNRGDGPVFIAGWTLSDRTGSYPYTFPAVVLLPSSSVTVFTGSGTMNDTALYRGLSSPVWGNSGDVAILRDGAGTIIDEEGEDVSA
ncbi:MAG: lamin tail domain-containing protein [Methanoregula sp.]